jgi:dextranase
VVAFGAARHPRGLPQNVVYIEVWPIHSTLGHLAALVTAALGDKPVVIAAYQHVYDTADVAEADLATAFTMATLFSHGASHLLCGEADRILADPNYVRNHRVAPSIADLLRRWYDFHVEHGELLSDPGFVDMTGALAGAYNDDCDLSYPASDVPIPGTVWRRVLGRGDRLVVHLINLTGQDDTEWDAPRGRSPSSPVACCGCVAAVPECRGCATPTPTGKRRCGTCRSSWTAISSVSSCRTRTSGKCS